MQHLNKILKFLFTTSLSQNIIKNTYLNSDFNHIITNTELNVHLGNFLM